MLTTEGYVKLADYGLSKCGMLQKGARATTYCGTPDFMPPEVVQGKPYGITADWWSFGVLLYELVYAKAPFHGRTEHDMFTAIVAGQVRFPKTAGDGTPTQGSSSPNLSACELTLANDLIKKCLQVDVKKRIKTAEELKRHPYFTNVDWDALLRRDFRPSFLPSTPNNLNNKTVMSNGSLVHLKEGVDVIRALVGNFEEEFTRLPPNISPVPSTAILH